MGVPSSKAKWSPTIRTPPRLPAGFSSQFSMPMALGDRSLAGSNLYQSGPASGFTKPAMAIGVVTNATSDANVSVTATDL